MSACRHQTYNLLLVLLLGRLLLKSQPGREAHVAGVIISSFTFVVLLLLTLASVWLRPQYCCSKGGWRWLSSSLASCACKTNSFFFSFQSSQFAHKCRAAALTWCAAIKTQWLSGIWKTCCCCSYCAARPVSQARRRKPRVHTWFDYHFIGMRSLLHYTLHEDKKR